MAAISLLIENHTHDPEMVRDPQEILMDVGASGPAYYWNTDFHKAFPSSLTSRVDVEGVVDVVLTAGEYEMFKNILNTIRPC